MSNFVKPRVFVSSVISGFGPMREAARQGILSAGCEPVLVNEDFPSSPVSPRNACLDAVESCDALVALVGERGGSRAPSGKLVIEEEFEHARVKGLLVFAFLQGVPRDPSAAAFAARLSDYITGHLRSTFETSEELEAAVEKALRRAYGEQGMTRTVSGESLDPDLVGSRGHQQEPILRFVLAPERAEDLVDIVVLEDPGFEDRVYRVAHDGGVKLMHFKASKEERSRTDEGVLFSQVHHPGTEKKTPDVYLEIRPRRIVIDRELGGVRDGSPFANMAITESELAESLRSCFAFSDALYETFDAYRRHARLLCGTSVANFGYHVLVKEIPVGGMSLAIRADGRAPIVPESGRVILRDDLRSPEREIERTLVQYRRKLGPA